jgi:phosphonoacetaldehyde hydrolase
VDFHFKRQYCGTLKACVFDWAGTTCDFGCMAPASVFIELFHRHGISATMEEARAPMGMHKKDHIRTMLGMPAIAQQWKLKHSAAPGENDVEKLFEQFVPMQIEAIAHHADVIPGTLDCMKTLRNLGIGIGTTTGYNAKMMEVLVSEAKRQGYAPDNLVTVSDVPAGRPAPWMALESAKRLGVYPMEAAVKIGDTPVDIEEGLNAGMWTIAVVEHGNEVGLPQSEFEKLAPGDRAARVDRAYTRLAQAGAHYIVNTIAEVPIIVDEINARLTTGEKP